MKTSKKTSVTGSEFIDNANTVASGGAITDCSELTVTDSTFINNNAVKSAGAINVAYNKKATITHSTFINNTAGENGGTIANNGQLTINYCVLISNDNKAIIYNDEYSKDTDAQFNWWGTNDNPKDLVASVDDVDDWGDSVEGGAIDTSNWVVMNIAANSTTVDVGEMVELTVGFTNYNATDSLKPLAESIPEVTVTAEAIKGALNATEEITSGNIAKFLYVPAEPGVNTIDFTSAEPAVQFNITVNEPVVIEIIYVSATGSDENNGSTEDNAVATIAHAIELANAAKGKIIILEGTYAINSTLKIAQDLDIEGRGTVTIDGQAKQIIVNNANVNLNLTNLIFTNAKNGANAAIADSGNTIIEGCTFYNCNSTGTSSIGPINNLKGTMVINNSKFYANRGARGVVASQSATILIVNNSEFYDNDCTVVSNSNGIIYGTSADLIIENTVFRNNKAKSGAGIYVTRASSATTGSLTAENLTFEDNIANLGTGGAIFISGTKTAVTINNSKFINNTATGTTSATGLGGAIYVGSGSGSGAPDISVTQSVFVDNSGIQGDAGICVNGAAQGSSNLPPTFTISDSIILAKDGDSNCALNKLGTATVTAENNWWGSNDKANTNVSVEKIVKMTAALDPETAQAGDAVTVTATFDNDKLPDGFIEVAFTSSTGSLDKKATVNNAQASVSYDGDADDLSITVKSGEAEMVFEFDPEATMIFVSPSGNDTNSGTRESPVASLAKALELATKGKIVLLEGTYKTGDLGVISNDLSIAGEGNAIIDADNNNAILYVGDSAKVVISNVTMINGYSADSSGGLLANTNELTLINCTIANSSSANNGGAIFNTGKLTIINTTFDNCAATRGGAIYSQSGTDSAAITIANSAFTNNVARGSERYGGGAIYAQRGQGFYTLDLTIDNTTFTENRAEGTSCGGAIALEQLNFNVKITDSEFIANHANGQTAASGSSGLLGANEQIAAGGGAIYASSAELYTRGGTIDITGTLFENNTCDANGAAIYAKTTTVNVANSMLVNNNDANGVAVYGEKNEYTSPAVTLNDNWWGSNDDPSVLVGGNGYDPSLSRWAILTITNDTPIAAGETVTFTISINNYTTGTENGTMSKPITVKRNMVLSLNKDEIPITLEDGVATYTWTVPADTKLVAATVDGETQVLFAVSSPVAVEIGDVDAKKYENVHVEINVTSDDAVSSGIVELYVNGDKLIASIDVADGKAVGDVLIFEEEGSYNLTAKYIAESPLFEDNQTNATLTVSGITELVNETFFNFFDADGFLRDQITEDELVFHGDFGGLGVANVIITKPIKITGDDAKLNNMTISIFSSDVVISNMTLNATTSVGDLIGVYESDVEISNVDIYYAVGNEDAVAINVMGASNVKITDNSIYFESHVTNEPSQAIAINVEGAANVVIDKNDIKASFTTVDSNWALYTKYGMMGVDSVSTIRVDSADGVEITNNNIDTSVNALQGYYPTVQSVIILGSSGILFDSNNVTVIDAVTGKGNVSYLYGLVLGFADGNISNNNFDMSTEGGANALGSAYPINIVTSDLNIVNNNITSVSNGPNIGIYVSFSYDYDHMMDEFEVNIMENDINITGFSSSQDASALLSGI